jgi:serine/threonine-protein kinase
MQSEIAQRVAEQLHAKISPVEKASIERPTTTDLTAFDLYSRAKNLLLTTSFSGSERANLLETADLLNRAVMCDPSFFQAYCQLAYTHDLLYFLAYDHTKERLASAEAAIQAAFRLLPDAGEVHLARAENFYRGYLDYDSALAELEIARLRLPNDPRLFELKGYIQRRQGHWEESTANLQHAADLDPRNVYTLQQIALSYDHLRRYAEEETVLDRALAVEPNDAEMKAARALVEFDWKGHTRPLHQVIDLVRAKNPAPTPGIAEAWLVCALAERDAAAARDALTVSGQFPFNDEVVHLNRPFLEGVIARMKNSDAQASTAFRAAHAEQEKTVAAQPDYGPALCVLGLIDAALGQKEDALREGRRAVQLLPVEKDSINGPRMIAYLAMTAAWAGDKNLACERLAIAARLAGGATYGQLKLFPFWDPLRGDPCFEKIVASLAPKEN